MLTQWAEYQDRDFGIFPPFEDEHIEQIPLRISTLRSAPGARSALARSR